MPWTRLPEASALLASCAIRPPRRQVVVYRFQEIATRFVGRRVARLRRLYRRAEPPVDSLDWRSWLGLEPQAAIEGILAAARSAPVFQLIIRGEKDMPQPIDPALAHRRLIAALCDDLASPDYRRSGRTPRADALLAGTNGNEPAPAPSGVGAALAGARDGNPELH